MAKKYEKLADFSKTIFAKKIIRNTFKTIQKPVQ